jgi:hypothetical protein
MTLGRSARRVGGLMLWSAVAAIALAAGAEPPIDVGGRKQLFIDDRFIANAAQVRRVSNPAQKLGRIKDEKGVPYFAHVNKVLDHDGKTRLYIGADRAEVIESEDGFTFRRTGVTLKGEFPTILLDAHEPDPARRYKLFWGKYSDPFNPATDGVYGAYSRDGVRFVEPRVVLPFWTDNPTIVSWDERLAKYVVYMRAHAIGEANQRRVARIVTDDPLKPWPYMGKRPANNLFCVENADVVLKADGSDDPMSDIYYNSATEYPWAQDVRLMFLANFRHFGPKQHSFIRPNAKGQWEDFGMLEVQLAVSRDGVRWERLNREAYFPTGLADEWDRWYATMGPGMVRRGSYLYQYYTSSGRGHDGVVLRPEYDHSAKELGGIGVVRQRLDGFVSVDADHNGGSFETPALKFDGKRLRLNVDTGSMGTAFVEIRDEGGKPFPGFTLDACEEIGGNFIDQTVYFKGNSDLSALAGRPVKLHFKLKRAKLFAFQFTAE